MRKVIAHFNKQKIEKLMELISEAIFYSNLNFTIDDAIAIDVEEDLESALDICRKKLRSLEKQTFNF